MGWGRGGKGPGGQWFQWWGEGGAEQAAAGRWRVGWRPLWQAEVPPGPDAPSAPRTLVGQKVQNKELITWFLGCGEGIRGGVPALFYPYTYGPRPRRILPAL